MENMAATTREFQLFEFHQAITETEAGLKVLSAGIGVTQEMVKAEQDASQEMRG
jgi:hypothetical protein